MDVSIIIVSWNVRDLVVKCLETIFKYTKELKYEVIVVDNASNDSSIKAIRQEFQTQIKEQKLLLIDNHQNLGFAKANNQGLKEARGNYVLFMNPDMELIENTVLKLNKYMENHLKTGISTCTLLYGDQTLQPNVKNDPTLFSQVLILLKLHHVLKNIKALKKYFAKNFDYNQQAEVKQVMGAFIFIRKKIMDQINGWDEKYWLWWEDIDLCRQVRHLNYKIVYLPISQVIHLEGKSFEQQTSFKKQKRFIKAMLIYFKKYHNSLSYIIILMIAPISLFLSFITQILKIKPKSQSRI